MQTRLSDDDSKQRVEEVSHSEIALIRLLHPVSDGFIAFAAGDEDGMYPKVAVRSDVLPSEEIPVPPRDSYVSINQAFRLNQRGRRPKNAFSSAIGVPYHRTDTLRYLCAAYVDLDHYKEEIGFSGEEVMAQILEMQGHGCIPQPSMLVYSGRGTWVVWLLRDAGDMEKPVRIYREGCELAAHRQIQKAFHRRFARLGSDSQAYSPARYLRIPGSLSTKSEEIVQWVPQLDESGAIPLYTVAQLQGYLGIESASTQIWPKYPNLGAPKQPRPSRLDVNGKPRRGRAGWEALRSRRLRDFHKLWQLRSTFKKGVRNNALFYYGILLMTTGKPLEAVYADLCDLNKSCRPHLSEREVRSLLNSLIQRTYRKLLDQTVADWLDITPHEASNLECEAVATRFHNVTSFSVRKPTRSETDAARICARHIAIEEIVAKRNGDIPSTRRMVKLLAEKGVTAGHATISKDYKLLELDYAGSETTAAA